MNSLPQRPDPSEPAGISGSPWALPGLLAVAAAAFVLISMRPLTHSEVRYVEAGSEMAASGDWVVPHLSYVPYFEKPILTYWAEAASQLAFGASPLAARVPSILAGVFMVWATYAIGKVLRGPAFGLGAAGLLLSAAMFDVMGSVMTTDPLFSALLAAAWYAFLRHDRAPRSAWIWAFWTALGFAVLTKGPLGVALVGSTVGAYLLLSGRLRDLLALRMVRGTLVILAVNAPWSYLVWQRDPRFLRFFYVRENLQALVNSNINHAGPPWYYLPVLVGAFFPFSVTVAWALGAEVWRTLAPAVKRLVLRATDLAPPDPGHLYAACMLLPPLLLLSVSASTLATNIMPLFPAAALVAAWYIADRVDRPTWFMRWSMSLQGAVLAMVVGGALVFRDRLPADYSEVLGREAGAIGTAAALIVLAHIAGGWAMVRGRIVPGMSVVAIGVLSGIVVLGSAADEIQGERDAGGLVEQLVRVRSPGERVIVAGPVVDDYTISMGLKERTYVWGFARELGMGHFAEVTPPSRPIPDEPYDLNGKMSRENPWLVDIDELKVAWTGPDRVWLVGRPKDVEKLREEGLHPHLLAATDKRAIVSNQPLPRSR